MIGLIHVKTTLPLCRRYLLAGRRILPSSKEMLYGASCKSFGLQVHGVKVEDANGYPQVNPNEKRITDSMKVNVP